jgi:hypothetical protein
MDWPISDDGGVCLTVIVAVVPLWDALVGVKFTLAAPFKICQYFPAESLM